MMNKKDEAETKVLTELVQLGYEVFTPFKSSTQTDLVAQDLNGQLHKIRVKIAKKDGDIISSQLGTSYTDSNGTNARKYKDIQVDIVVLYCPQLDECYSVEAENINNIKLNTTNKQSRRNTYPAEEYKLKNGL